LNNLFGPVNVIVQYNSTPGLVQQLELVALGGTITHQYSAIPAVSVTLPGAGILGLLRDPLVSFISLDRQVAGTLDLTTAASGANYAFQAGYSGAGVGIAILDSGIYNHPDVAGRVVYRQSFVASTNLDDSGHGTHLAGIAAGDSAASGGVYRGVALARILSICAFWTPMERPATAS